MKLDFTVRNATINDIPFIVNTIVEAEKSGTEKLSYSTIFDLSEVEIKKYIEEMLLEEVDDCELSLSSFLIAEIDGEIAAALSAWVEGACGVPSSILKGNLLHFHFPKESFKKANNLNAIISDIHIEYLMGTIQIGAGYVAAKFRGNKLLGLLNYEIIKKLSTQYPHVTEIYAQIFSCNIPSIKTYEKANFELVMKKKSENINIKKYLPSDEKILMRCSVKTFLKA